MADVIGQDSCQTVWEAFHQWSKEQIDDGNCVYVKGFAVVGYEISREGVRILNIKLLENFLSNHHIALEPGERERMSQNVTWQPQIPINFKTLSERAGMTKGKYQIFFASIL